MGSNWYAPSLTSLQEASTADWPIEDITRLLKTGSTSRAVTTGPMANVVSQSLQFLTEDDARAVAKYLKSLPETEPRSRGMAPPLTEEVDKQLKKGGRFTKPIARTVTEIWGKADREATRRLPATVG